jgi:transcriptional regulator with XRE-family HTH domain
MDNNISKRFSTLLNSKTKERQLKRDAQILMDNFLSEIERLYTKDGLNRKTLANNIEISESYVSQIFNGKKPLNFVTLAKIKRALNINFDVTAYFISEKKTEITYPIISLPIPNDALMQNVTTTLAGGHSETIVPVTKTTVEVPYNSKSFEPILQSQ